MDARKKLEKKSGLLSVFIMSFFLAPNLQAQNTPLSQIPSSLAGIYDLKMEASDAESPIANGTTAIVSISLNGTLCADNTAFISPFTKPGSTTTIYWASANSNIEFSVSTTLPFTGINVGNFNGNSFGSLKGEKTSSVTDNCGPLDTYTSFFEKAENLYPKLFPGSIFVFTQQNSSSTYRYYPASNIYLSISDSKVTASGGAYGNTPVLLGNVQNLLDSDLADIYLPLTTAPEDFDNYYFGTYILTFENATTFSPVKNGTQLTFVITPGKQLCVGENVLEAPLYKAEGEGMVVWNNALGGYYYQLDLIRESEKQSEIESGNIQLYNAGGEPFGSFVGIRSELNADCNNAAGPNPDLAEIDLMFNLAEQHMSELFPGGPQTYNQKSNGYIYRFYKETGVTIQVKDRMVYGKGNTFGNEFVFVGNLNNIIRQLQERAISISIPSEFVGTFTTTFTSSGIFSPIPDGEVLDFALMANGSICLNGNIMSSPYFDTTNKQKIHWKDPNAGFELSLNLESSGLTDISLDVNSSDGVPLGFISGSKSLILAECAGILGNNINIETANELFELAEQYFPKQFPPSALTYNRFDGTSLLRYYPSTGILVTLTGEQVKVQGGVYGSTEKILGNVKPLIAAIEKQQGISTHFTLSVNGEMLYKQDQGTPLNLRVGIRKEGIALPSKTDNESLTNTIRQILGNELRGNSTFEISVITNDKNLLIFDVIILNETKVVSSKISRNYTLQFMYSRI